MLAIRFLRQGKKHQPSYKIVAVEKGRSVRSGKFIEQLGFYNPITKEKSINAERVKYWLSKGAKPSDTLNNLLVKEGIIDGKRIAVHSTKKKPARNASPARMTHVSVSGGHSVAGGVPPQEESKPVSPAGDEGLTEEKEGVK